jgi:hypothetical protein
VERGKKDDIDTGWRVRKVGYVKQKMGGCGGSM